MEHLCVISTNAETYVSIIKGKLNIMRVYILIYLVLCAFTQVAYSKTITCEQSDDPWASINTLIELSPPGATITLGSEIPDYTVIYTQDNVTLGQDLSTCDKSVYLYQTILDQGLKPVNTIAGDNIYPTDVPGIGISVYSSDVVASLPVFPNMVMSGWISGHTGEAMTGKIKFWKIPGDIPMRSGALSVNGPVVGQVISNPPYTFANSDGSTDRVYSNGQYYVTSSRQLHATLIFEPGTCEIEGDDVVVNMGEHPGVRNENSAWKEASFKLICQDAHGYGGITAMNNAEQSPFGAGSSTSVMSENNQQNGRVKLAVVPYTAIVDSQQGIIALDGTGATGYGIQLAWGDYSSQNTGDPAKPVRFGASNSVYVSELNAQFRSTSTPVDGNAFTGGDNTIEMSARYIRTKGDVMPGPANATVQVIANYE
jgi:type 1 fimbria pilin